MKGFTPAKWRGTTGDSDAIGLSFETEVGVLRLKLDVASAQALCETIPHYLRRKVHSDNASGKPSPSVSPQEGV